MSDLISRQAAIDAIEQLVIPEDMCVFEILSHIELAIGTLPSAQPELEENPLQEQVDDILQYLDEYLHPIVSPEHWSVYSDLHDMVSMLPSVQLEREPGEWVDDGDPLTFTCSKCGYSVARYNNTNFCPNCGNKKG